tara:strand:- start:56 stop:580 length:525 start_codon:yes stop_codon:yes gene_type:complete
MKVYKTKFKGLIFIKSNTFKDNRGFSREIGKQKIIKNKLVFTFVSKSNKNVLRGLHTQIKNQQGKFISVIKGKILDVAVDCRIKSKTFGKHFKKILSAKNSTSVYIPPGFIHGFLGLDSENIIIYNCTNYRDKKSEKGIKWDDKDLNIKWPIKNPILSKKDKNNFSFKKYLENI